MALPWAIGVLVSPTATIAVILLLMTPRAKANAAALIAGWLISLCLVVVIAYVGVTALGIGDVRGRARDEITSLVLGSLLVIMGGLLLWRTRRRSGPAGMPRWLETVDSFTPGRSFAVGLAVADVKNLILAVAAVSALAAGSGGSERLLPFVLFVLIGSLGVLMPAGVYVVKGDRAELTLKRWRDWLVSHNAVIMTIVLFVCGATLIARGSGAGWAG